jgi:hypothetical protein
MKRPGLLTPLLRLINGVAGPATKARAVACSRSDALLRLQQPFSLRRPF